MEVPLPVGQVETLGVAPPALTPSFCRILRRAAGSGEKDTALPKARLVFWGHMIFISILWRKNTNIAALAVFDQNAVKVLL